MTAVSRVLKRKLTARIFDLTKCMIYDSKCVPHKGSAKSPAGAWDTLIHSLTHTLSHSHLHTRIWSSQSKDNYEPHLLGMLVYCQSRVNTNQLRHYQSTEWGKQRERENKRKIECQRDAVVGLQHSLETAVI